MKTKFHLKFLFTQLSGVLVGLVWAFMWVLILKIIWPNFVMESQTNIFKASVVGITTMVNLLVALYLWGKILVFIKVLSKEEAKGYPWAKPWENIFSGKIQNR